MKKNTLNGIVKVACVLSAISFCHASDNLKEEFKGNWSGQFRLIDGSIVSHEPNRTSMGFMSAGTGISMNAKSFNGMPMSEYGLHLKTNSTQEEFVESLLRSGLYRK